MASGAYPTAYRTSASRGSAAPGFQGAPSRTPANDRYSKPIRMPDPAQDNWPKVPKGALNGMKLARLGGKFIPYIGVALTLYDLYQMFRWFQGGLVVPNGWTHHITCNPASCNPNVGPAIALSNLGATACFCFQAVTQNFTSSSRAMSVWHQANVAGTRWNLVSSWRYPTPQPLPNPGPATMRAPQVRPMEVPQVHPMADPFSLPIGVPVPLVKPLPWRVLPYRRHNPWREDQREVGPKPQPNPNPAPSPTPTPGPLVPVPAVPPPPTGGPRGPARPHRRPYRRINYIARNISRVRYQRRRPGRGTKEVKLKVSGVWMHLLMRTIANVTETIDWIDAIHDALPLGFGMRAEPVWEPGYGTSDNPFSDFGSGSDPVGFAPQIPGDEYGRFYSGDWTPYGVRNDWREPTPYEKGKKIYENIEYVNWEAAVRNIVVQHLTDMLIGTVSRGASSNYPYAGTGGPGIISGPAI